MIHHIHLAERDDQIAACFHVMQQLRPTLHADDFVARIRTQMADGYQLVYILDGGAVACVAGYRVASNLAWGQHLYVDDLVTDEPRRNCGLGRSMMQWLIAQSKTLGCQELHLDSGVARTDAHHLYHACGLAVTSHHFTIPTL